LIITMRKWLRHASDISKSNKGFLLSKVAFEVSLLGLRRSLKIELI